MVKILGLPFDDYVDKQVKTRQAKLAKTQKSPEDLSVFNSNTAWVRLSSGVKVESDRAETLSARLGIGKSSIEGTALAKNLVLWGGVSSFTADGTAATLDPIKGGIGYGLNNTYGFLSGPEQGLKPPPGITSITCNYKNNGSLKQATVSMKCYTRSQFEAIEAVYLRLGYTVVLEWGNTLWFDNEGQFKQTQAYSIPNILFKDQNDVDPQTIYDRLAFNKKATACNYDGMLGKVVNYSWAIVDDLSFDIKLELISTGDIIDSLKINIGGTNTKDLTSQIQVSESFQNLVAIQVNKEASKLNGFFYELYDEIFKPLLQDYGSPENQKAVEEIDKAVEAVDDLEPIRQKYVAALQEFRKYYTYFQDGLAIHNRAPYKVQSDGKEIVRSILPQDQAAWANIAKNFNISIPQLLGIYFDGTKESEVDGVERYRKSLEAIESYFTNLKADTSNVTLNTINYFKNQKAVKEDIIFALNTGFLIAGTETVKVEGSRYEDGNTFNDKKFSQLLEDLIEGLNVS
jgi:hypothetical protein